MSEPTSSAEKPTQEVIEVDETGKVHEPFIESNPHSGQAVDMQEEWTPEKVAKIGKFRSDLDGCKDLADAHNTALAANDDKWRERFRKFEKIEDKFGPASQRSEGQAVDRQEWEYKGVGYFRQKGEPQGKIAPIIHAPELVEQLKAALAAERQDRDEHDEVREDEKTKVFRALNTTLDAVDAPKDEWPCNRISKLVAEARKPLVETLQEARYVIASLRSFVLSGESLSATDEQNIQAMLATIDAALAKVKEKP